MTPPPLEPGRIARQGTLVAVLIGSEVTETAHAAHPCGRQELCAVEPGAPPHVPDHVVPVLPEPEPFPPRVTTHVPKTERVPKTIHAAVTLHVPVGS